MDEITKALEENGDGFVKAMWCGNEECEDKVKEITGVGSRCIPFDQEEISDVCVCCGKPAKKCFIGVKLIKQRNYIIKTTEVALCQY